MSIKSFFSGFQAICVVLVNSILLLALINWGIICANRPPDLATERLAERSPKGETLESILPALSRDEIAELIRVTDSRRFQHDLMLSFREQHPFESRFVNLSEHGFRLIKDQAPWPIAREGYFNVFVFGGSTTFGYWVPDGDTVPSYLQEALNDLDLEKPARVYNFGNAEYYSTREMLLFTKLLILGHEPDMVVFIDGLNEFFMNDDLLFQTRPGSVERHYATALVNRNLPVIESARRLGVRITRRLGLAPPRNPATTDPAAELERVTDLMIERYRDSKTMLEAITSRYGIEGVFVWQPQAIYKTDWDHHLFREEDYKFLFERLKLGYAKMERMHGAGVFGDDLIWSADIAEHKKKPLYVSPWHYSPEMSRALAAHIVEQLVARGRLPVTPVAAEEPVAVRQSERGPD